MDFSISDIVVFVHGSLFLVYNKFDLILAFFFTFAMLSFHVTVHHS